MDTRSTSMMCPIAFSARRRALLRARRRRVASRSIGAVIALVAGLALGATPAIAAARSTVSPQPPRHGSRPVRTARPRPRPAGTIVGAADPLAGTTLYVDPDSDAARQATAWRQTDPAGAAAMATLAAQPTAGWFTGDNGDVTTAVGSLVAAAARAGAVPLLVAYDIPDRDCGGYSAGGAASAAAYRQWISAFAAGIGSQRAIVILEPDALAQLGCLPASAQATRLALLRYAVRVLGAHAGVDVYLDAGHYGWQPAASMAKRLVQAGIARAQGFSLNVAGFDSTGSETAYGDAISALAGGRHFVIDTSRNGAGSDGQWCNAPGRALGADPTTDSGNPLVDALLWIKTPGESDGTCNGGPAAGTWWPPYAMGLTLGATP
jgi:endoglucanase